MPLHEFSFFRGQGTRLEENTVGDSQLTDVVQMRSFGQASQLIFWPAQGAGNLQRVTADALGVAGRFIVAKIDCRTECLQGVFVSPFELLESLTQLESAVRNHFFEVLPVVFDLLLQEAFVKG